MRRLWIGGLFVIAFGCGDAPPVAREMEAPDKTARGAGLIAAKKVILPALKAPATADFPWDTIAAEAVPDYVGPDGSSAERWKVHGFVDAENSFGAMLRSPWEITLLHVGDEWFPVEALLDGERVFQLDGYAVEKPPTPTANTPSESPTASAPQPRAEGHDEETKAAAMLANAKNIRAKNREAGDRWLRRVIDDFPQTTAAAEATSLLEM